VRVFAAKTSAGACLLVSRHLPRSEMIGLAAAAAIMPRNAVDARIFVLGEVLRSWIWSLI